MLHRGDVAALPATPVPAHPACPLVRSGTTPSLRAPTTDRRRAPQSSSEPTPPKGRTAVAHVLLTCHLPADAEPTIDHAAAALGVPTDAVDPEFGVVLIDPKAGSYAVMVDERHAGDATARADVEGPFANPRIETFGPPDDGGSRPA
jgi:hypothetical protein